MDLTFPNLDSEDLYLLLPSDLAGPADVLVELLRPSDGIMEVLDDLTLSARDNEAFVGVVIELGRRPLNADGVGSTVVFSVLASCEAGRLVEVSSPAFRLVRLPGAVFSIRSVSIERSDLEDTDFGSPLTCGGSSSPAFEPLRFNDVVVV